MSVEELNNEHVLLLSVGIVLEPIEELGYTDVVVVKELNNVHALSVLELLADCGVRLQEFSD